MKIQHYILVLFVAITSSMCNKTQKENTISTVEKKHTETENCSQPMTKADSLKMINHQIEIKGDVKYPLQLTVDSLQKMKVATITDFKVVCQTGQVKKDNKTCKGVLLKDILEKAKIKQNGHKDRNFYIVARASDNYKATFSWAELFNNPTGENAYVIFEENGKPVEKGEMILICTNDIKTGPRHVYWLKSIEVYKVK
ncbi:molybdopterin-dependent oxidoreductase [Flavobacterium adhaerens]|uniref:molybdopterin-dependent oxidoreductase n=1 Tax=Flavobacterium adhaerens TaxID=3149043 RepID=UPI0032B58C35